MIEIFQRRAGRSATRRYKKLSREWRRRVLGRRFRFLYWGMVIALVIAIPAWHLGRIGMLYAGVALGGLVALWILLPEALMPAQIARWQLGAWGEQNTASELNGLRRDGWAVVHDVVWSERANHDHVVAGPAVFVLNTKNVKDSRVTAEGSALRVTQLESEDSYVADRWLPMVEREAKALHRELARILGFPVYVYPVIVIWGAFDEGPRWIGDVAVVHGSDVASWIRSRPADILLESKREVLVRAVKQLPQA